MDSLCPAESSITRRRLCAILVTDDLDEDEEARRNLRKFARQFKYSRDRVTFSYIFREKQPELLRSLVQGIYWRLLSNRYCLINSKFAVPSFFRRRIVSNEIEYRCGLAAKFSVFEFQLVAAAFCFGIRQLEH